MRGAAACLACGFALLQPPRPILPTDQYGPAQSAGSLLENPGEPISQWILRPEPPAYQLQLGGVLAQAGPDTIRVRQGGAAADALVSLTPATNYFLDGRSVTQPEIPEGSRVLVLFDLAGDVRVASTVQASSPGNPVPPAETLQPAPPPFAAEIPGERVTSSTPQQLLPAGPGFGGVTPEAPSEAPSVRVQVPAPQP